MYELLFPSLHRTQQEPQAPWSLTSVTAFFILQSTVSGSWPASALASDLAPGTCSRIV